MPGWVAKVGLYARAQRHGGVGRSESGMRVCMVIAMWVARSLGEAMKSSNIMLAYRTG